MIDSPFHKCIEHVILLCRFEKCFHINCFIYDRFFIFLYFSGGEWFLSLSSHLQTIPQEHYWERWRQHQEGILSLIGYKFKLGLGDSSFTISGFLKYGGKNGIT